MKRNILLLSLVLLLLSSALYFLLYQKSKTPQYTGPVETIKIGVSKASPEVNLLFFIAEDQGYFKKHGISTQLVTYDSSVHIHEAVDTKKVDMGITGDFTFVIDNFKRESLQILTGIGKLKFLSLIVRTDNGIHSPEDLKGKRIALVPKTSVEFLFHRFLVFNNISEKDIQIVPTTVDQLRPLLQQGSVDGITFTESIAREIKAEMPDKIDYWSIQENQPNYVMLTIHKDTALQRQQAYQRFLAALIEAEQYLKRHQAESLKIVAKHLTPQSTQALSSGFDNYQFEIFLDQPMLLTMEDEAGWAIENKLVTQTAVPNYLNYIYFDALEEVKPEAVTLIH